MIRPRTLLLFYRRHLRVQPLREMMAVAGVAVGVALLFAVQVTNGSITASFAGLTHSVAGRATLEVASRGPEGFDAGIAEEVAVTKGVQAIAPVLEQQIVAAGPRGSRALTLVGSDERLAELGGKLVSQFERVTEARKRGLMVMTEQDADALGVRPGALVTVRIGERTERLSLDAAVPSSRLGGLAGTPIAAASLPVVQSLAQLPGRVTRILIEPRPGQGAAVERALTERLGRTLNVRPVSTEARYLAQAAGPESQVTTLFSVISVLVGIILAYNALLLASGERRLFIGYLVELGTPDLAIIASLVFDALVLGLAGCVIGLVLGDAISLYAYSATPGYLTAAFPIGGQRVLSLHAVLIALAGGMLAAFAAAGIPALGLMRSSAAQSDSGSPARTLAARPAISAVGVFALGATLVCASTVISLLDPAVTIVALAALVAGLALCIPMIVRYVLLLARAASRHVSDPAARLSTSELQSTPARSTAMFATGAVAVLATVLIGGSVGDVERAVRVGAKDTAAAASLWLRPGDRENIYATQPFRATDTEARLKRLRVVSAVLSYQQSFLDLPNRRVWAIGVPANAPTPIAASQLVSGGLWTASQRLREGGWALITASVANEERLHLGERFSLPTPSGSASFRLAGTISNYSWLPGTVLMNGGDYSRLWQSSSPSELGIVLAPGVSPEAGIRAVREALPSNSALALQTDAERQAEVVTVLGSTLSRLKGTSTVVLLVAIAAVVAMMVAAVWQRRGRLDALISIGMSFGQLARLVFYESGSVLLAGCMLGMAAGILSQDLGDHWLDHTIGIPAQFAPAWGLGLRTVLIATGISAAAAILAILRTVGFEPKAAFSTD